MRLSGGGVGTGLLGPTQGGQKGPPDKVTSEQKRTLPLVGESLASLKTSNKAHD